SINAQLRVTDTGGNTAFSNTLTLSTIADPIQPTVTGVSPPTNSKRSSNTRSIRIDFSESIDPTTATAQNIRLLDSSNHAFNPIDIQTRRDDKTVQFTYDTLPVGDYQINVTSGVTDRAGNTLLNLYQSSFTIAPGTII